MAGRKNQEQLKKNRNPHAIIAPQPGPQALAMQSDADLIIYGGAAGAGKSHLLLMHCLQHVRDPNFNAVYFRKVTTQLTGAGGLWPESQKLYLPFGTSTRTKPALIHRFPTGATVSFMHMQHEDNKLDHQGLQYSAIYFDEGTHFSESQVTYLLSRLRSEADSNSYCMISCNPDPDSWLYKWVEWYLDEEGFPVKEKNGVKRFYIMIEDAPVFADTEEELMERYPDSCRVYNPVDNEWIEIRPKSFCFISGTIFDNPILIKKNPKYLAELQSLPKIERARLLDGNWKLRPQGANYFQRDWLIKAEYAPLHCKEVRSYDKASTEPSETNRYPDYTASIKILKDTNGFYYIRGDYIPENRDDGSYVYGRFRKRPGARDNIIERQAIADGSDCTVVLAQDPGSAGAVEFQESAKKLIASGIVVASDPSPATRSKLKRFEPFSSAAQNGLVYIIESSFPNRETLEHFYNELEAFDGERSGKSRKDDFPDATASGFNYLAKEKVIPSFTLGQNNSPTKLKQVMSTVVPEFNR